MEQSSAKHLETGKIGEREALKYLIGKGYSIICTNYWKPYGEIDIVAERNKVLHFVEVKSMTTPKAPNFNDFTPEDHMNFGKQQRQRRVIETYLAEKGVGEREYFVDLACVYLDQGNKLIQIEYIEDIKLA